MGEQPLAQVGLDADGDRVGRDVTKPGKQGAPENEDQNQAQDRGHLRQGLSPEEDSVDGPADEPGLADGQEASQKSSKNRKDEGKSRVAGEGQESAVHKSS